MSSRGKGGGKRRREGKRKRVIIKGKKMKVIEKMEGREGLKRSIEKE